MNGKTLVFLVTAICGWGQLLSAAEPEHTQITVAKMHSKGCAKKIAAQLYTVPGVKSVSVDITTKMLTIVPQKGKTLSPRMLCEAVENTDDRPVRFVGPGITLVREYSEASRDQSKNRQCRIEIVVEKMHCKGCAQKIASELYALPGVKSVSVTVSRNTLYVTPASGSEVSLWAIWEAVQKAKNRALDIRGPTGSLKDAELAAKHRQESPVR